MTKTNYCCNPNATDCKCFPNGGGPDTMKATTEMELLQNRINELERKLDFMMAYTGADNIPEINQRVIMGID